MVSCGKTTLVYFLYYILLKTSVFLHFSSYSQHFCRASVLSACCLLHPSRTSLTFCHQYGTLSLFLPAPRSHECQEPTGEVNAVAMYYCSLRWGLTIGLLLPHINKGSVSLYSTIHTTASHFLVESPNSVTFEEEIYQTYIISSHVDGPYESLFSHGSVVRQEA
jgi:hypothetical protein